MYPRKISYPKHDSFFLLGPRGTGKTTWVAATFPDALFIDLLEFSIFQELLRDPGQLAARIEASSKKTVIVDEVQHLPQLLNEIHRLIEKKKIQFILTGSSARKLRRNSANLLGGRARRIEMHPLTAAELGADFRLEKSLRTGHLPSAYSSKDPKNYLKSYVGVYLKEEVQQEALVRNLSQFASFLEIAAFSQGSVLSVQSVAKDVGIDRKTAENYFVLLEDLLIGKRVPVFRRKAKRKTIVHPKFYYFDAGVFCTLRKQGPLDLENEVSGIALETLVFQELHATVSNLGLDCEIHFWRTQNQEEVDFVLYGPDRFLAIEVKRSSRFRNDDLHSLKLFLEEYPQAKGLLLYTGQDSFQYGNISVLPVEYALPRLPELLKAKN